MLVIPLAERQSRTTISLPPTPTPLAESDAFGEIIGQSEVLEATKARARRVAPLDLPVLLLGETGAGKELFARALHRASKRAQGPFVAVNCGALSRELLASELFGYIEGAFTGARRGGLPGKFEQAEGGTLFLDEIGEMPLDMQPHLLRVLQDGVVVRLGDTRERRVSVRVIAATNRDMQSEIADRRFREDLYHRLCAVTLELPALRDRPGDIEAIVEHLNSKLARKYGCAPKRLDPAVQLAFLNYRGPGTFANFKIPSKLCLHSAKAILSTAPCCPRSSHRWPRTHSASHPRHPRIQCPCRPGDLTKWSDKQFLARSRIPTKYFHGRSHAGNFKEHPLCQTGRDSEPTRQFIQLQDLKSSVSRSR